MYAVVRSGGKQITVKMGDTVRVERLKADVGGKVKLGEVLAVKRNDDLRIGQPLVPGASVEATVLRHDLGKKVIVFKKKRRKQYRRQAGHRQQYTALRIDRIIAGSTRAAAANKES